MIIPVVFVFDQNYIIPAAVALKSLLENSSKCHDYHIHIFHNGLTSVDLAMLGQICEEYGNATLYHQDMKGKFEDLFAKTATKGHYTKEIYYKFLVPELLPNYDKALISDVDVVFTGDVAELFISSLSDKDTVLAGCVVPYPDNSWVAKDMKEYEKKFSKEEIEKLVVAGGLYVYNLKAMRDENLIEKFINFAVENVDRLLQPEQDVISMVCYPRIEVLPLNSMICSYCYDLFVTEDDLNGHSKYSKEQLSDALARPVQLHYATSKKPWGRLNCTKSSIWHQYVFATPFAERYLDHLDDTVVRKFNVKTLFKFAFSRSKYLAVVRKIR